MAQRAVRTAQSVGLSVRDQLRLLDDTDLVTAFLKSEERAFDVLVERYQTRLLNFIYRTVGDRERAEDLVQEVFVRVYRHLARFDRSKKFSTWIYTIASNLAKNELRNRSRNPLVFPVADEGVRGRRGASCRVRGSAVTPGRPVPQTAFAGDRGQIGRALASASS